MGCSWVLFFFNCQKQSVPKLSGHSSTLSGKRQPVVRQSKRCKTLKGAGGEQVQSGVGMKVKEHILFPGQTSTKYIMTNEPELFLDSGNFSQVTNNNCNVFGSFLIH